MCEILVLFIWKRFLSHWMYVLFLWNSIDYSKRENCPFHYVLRHYFTTLTFLTLQRFLRSQHAKSVCVLRARLSGPSLISLSNWRISSTLSAARRNKNKFTKSDTVLRYIIRRDKAPIERLNILKCRQTYIHFKYMRIVIR